MEQNQNHKKKQSKTLNVDLSLEMKNKLESIAGKEGKTQTKVVEELIRDYELYKRTIFSMSDDVKVIIEALNLVSGYEIEKYKLQIMKSENWSAKRKIPKEFRDDKKQKLLRLKTSRLLDELSRRENRNKNEIVDELILNYYYINFENKWVIYQIKDMLNIFKECLKAEMTSRVFNKIERRYFAEKYSTGFTRSDDEI